MRTSIENFLRTLELASNATLKLTREPQSDNDPGGSIEIPVRRLWRVLVEIDNRLLELEEKEGKL